MNGEGSMETTTTVPRIVTPAEGEHGFLGSIGVRWLIEGVDADQRFSLVEHPMSPRALAAPLHLHTREDEYSYVLEGRMGALLGDAVVEAGPGALVFKPRNQWHTFWNAGDEPCRVLEIISPAGFERFFHELSDLGGALNADPAALAALNERYGMQMRPESVPELLERFGLKIGEQLTGGWPPA
jgi:mannose-6-phosphate isomerase-like protein (cupin superfamily)